MILKTTCLALALWSMAATAGTDPAHEHRLIFDRCIASQTRGAELQRSDTLLVAHSRSVATVAVPPSFRSALPRLVAVARVPRGKKVVLLGVDSTRSAFALSSGAIFVSSALWGPQIRLDPQESAAVIAHELAHIEFSHVKDRLCHALASAGDESLLLSAATQATHQAIFRGDQQLALPMMQRNHARELQADRRGEELLRLAGFDPSAMGRMLLKVSRSQGGGYSEMHPAIETRLENLAMDRPGKAPRRSRAPVG